MNKHQQNYKKKPAAYADVGAARLARTVRLQDRRQADRTENYAKHRDVPKAVEETTSRSSDVAKRLQRWKVERDLKKKMESQKKKPFVVGVVHHKFYSPPVFNKKISKTNLSQKNNAQKVKHNPTPPKRITRATQKRLDTKLAGASATPSTSSTVRTQSRHLKETERRSPRKAETSFAPKNYAFNPPAGLAEMPLFGKFRIPKDTKTIESSLENEKAQELKSDEDNPWPRANNPPVDVMSTRKQASPLVRQEAIDRHSSDLLNDSSEQNLSLETFKLHLSSDDDCPTETGLSEKPVNAAKEEIEDKTDHNVENPTNEPEDFENLTEIAKIIEIDNTTPPRSGSPAPASFSPYIVSSRGKGRARKEQELKMGIRRSSANDIPTKETVMQNLNISVEEEEQTAQYFKFILQREIDKLTELCDKWKAIMEEPDLTEDARDRINQAVGQTLLLMRKKFERFRRLILDCETGKGEMLVRCKDLQGFWDMIYMEVKDCESRFLKLDFLRSKGWIEDQIVVTSTRVTKKKGAAKKPASTNPKSAARSWILAARKKKLQQEDPAADDFVIVTKKTVSLSEFETSPKPTDSRRSLRKSLSESRAQKQSTPKATPKKTPTSMRKRVQLSQASKSVSSPLAIIKISQMCKTPEVRMDESISYVNSDQTPGKGILKKSDDSSGRESSCRKSTRKVDFNDDVFVEEVAVADESQNSIDLGRALARIESYDEDSDDFDFSNNITFRGDKKRLDFEDDSFDESEKTETAESATVIAAIPEPVVPFINVLPPTPLQTAPTSASKILEESIEEEKSADTSVSTRVLRRRTVVTETPNKSNRRSMKAIDRRSIVDSSVKENSDPLGEWKMETNSEDMSNEIASENKTKGRRSARKSVRVNADDCAACVVKPKLPTTPHSRRSRMGSENLMSFESPSKPRARRSSFK